MELIHSTIYIFSFEPDNQKDPPQLKSLSREGHFESVFQMDIGTCFQPHLSYHILMWF